ncbi:MAG TPA: hypothetical protein QF359_09805, partial [Rhodospirillales bacterium]|nr:hypothetical protein [Rhodospirillales bacterium]
MKHRSKLVILTAAGALLAASPSMAQTKGGTLTVGMDRPMTGFDSSMNPRPEYNRRNAMLPVYEDLFSRGKDGKLIPVLGKSMKSSP